MKNCGLSKPEIERTDDPNLKIWYRHCYRLFVREGLFVRSIGNRQPCPNYVMIVPTALRETILNAVYDNPFAGHLVITHIEERGCLPELLYHAFKLILLID